jgi:cell wall-associated NlpC family hydrolase
MNAPIQMTSSTAIMSAPTQSSSSIGSIPAGASPNFSCFLAGQTVGTVNVWWFATYDGVTGYIASEFDNSTYASDGDIPSKYGIPWCVGTPTASIQPASNPQPSTYNPQSGSGSNSGGSTPAHTPVQRAIAWATQYNGKSFESGECLLFVEQAWSAAGVNIGTGGTAAHYWALDPRGYTRHTSRSPEVGSLVFWGATPGNSAGHVGIMVGPNTVISTSSWPEPWSGTTVHEWSFSGRNAAGYPFLGWMMP